ncbi:MAG: hypothetical protein H0T76_00600 [Nannocystis sp.]|nr:hypothetical protein [Nannocystis sp.]MBA3544959.1 hypothetical protein [Nannocystis sp.]
MLLPLIFALASSTQGAPEPSPEPQVQVRWTAPVGCPSVEYVRARTEALLGRELEDPRHPPVEASVTIRRQSGGWSASLELATFEGRRRRPLRAGTCEALADVVALLLAVTIDPTARFPSLEAAPDGVQPTDRSPVGIPDAVPVERSPEAPAPAPRQTPPPSPSPSPSPPPSPRPAPDHRRRLQGFVGAGFTLQGGGVPGLALGAAGSGGLAWARARLLVTAAYAAPVSSSALAPGARLAARQGWAAIAGCGLLVRRRLEVPLCGGWFAGAMRAVGSGLDDGRPVRLPWTGLVLGAGLRYVFHPRIAAAMDVLALVPVLRPSFIVDGLGVVHQAASLAASGQIGLELRFP